MVEYVHSNCFTERFRAAVSVLVGPCCPALLNCIDVDVHTVALLGNKMMMMMMIVSAFVCVYPNALSLYCIVTALIYM